MNIIGLDNTSWIFGGMSFRPKIPLLWDTLRSFFRWFTLKHGEFPSFFLCLPGRVNPRSPWVPWAPWVQVMVGAHWSSAVQLLERGRSAKACDLKMWSTLMKDDHEIIPSRFFDFWFAPKIGPKYVKIMKHHRTWACFLESIILCWILNV
jgi:hypothetical protein